MLDLALFRRPTFTAALAGSLCLGLSTLSLMSYLPVVLHDVLGTRALEGALVLLVWSVPSVVVAFCAGLIGRWISPRIQLAAGMALAGAGELLMLGLSPAGSWRHLLAGLLVTGVGTGLLNAGLARASVAVVPPARSGMGAGANNTARYVGAAIGVAVIAAVLGARAPTAAGAADGLDLTLLLCAALGAAAAVLSLLFVRHADFAHAEVPLIPAPGHPRGGPAYDHA
jgi:MFS family permease